MTKSTPKKIIRQAKKVARESKKDLRQFAKSFKAFRDALGRFTPKPAPKKPAPKKPAPKKPAPKKPAPKKPGKKDYTLKELASSKSNKLGTLFSNIEKNAAKIDALKDDNQYWAFRIFDRQSTKPYSSIASIARTLSASSGLADETSPQLVDKISFMVVGNKKESPQKTENKYQSVVAQRQAERKILNQEIVSEAGKLSGGQSVQGRRKSKFELLADVIQVAKKERDRANAAEKRISKLEKEFAKILKQVTKPAAKKKAAKKPTKKQLVRGKKNEKQVTGKTKSKRTTKSSRATGKSAAAKKASGKKTNTKKAATKSRGKK